VHTQRNIVLFGGVGHPPPWEAAEWGAASQTRRTMQMRAAVIYEHGGPGVFRYEEVPEPECPDGCVIVDAEAISLEGGDLLARALGQLPAVPHVVGYLSAGTVSEVAGAVQDRAVGDRVVALNATGSHAARRAVPAAMTWSLPAGLDAARASCVPVAFGTAYECLFTAGDLAEGQTVLIHAGAGGVGMAAIQLAKRAGATVISTASSDEKLDRLKALGLDHGINYATESFVERADQLTDSRGVDIVIDSRGVFLGGAILSEYARIHPMIGEMLELVARGELHVEIDRSFPLADAAAAHEYVESRTAFGRVIITP
jgi:NADPH2:quinone reductase